MVEDLQLITRDLKSNVGYDFDVNFHVNDDEEEYEAKEIRLKIKDAIDRYAWKYGYDYCEDGTRVLTLKKKDYIGCKIRSSCDIAIVYDVDERRQQYIHHNKKQRTYDWEYLPMSNHELEKRAGWLRYHGYWDEVKDVYIEKKNYNDDPDKHSRSLYAETINEVFYRHSKG